MKSPFEVAIGQWNEPNKILIRGFSIPSWKYIQRYIDALLNRLPLPTHELEEPLEQDLSALLRYSETGQW